MSDILEELGLDPDDVKWTDLSLCVGMPTNMFYEDYESNEQVANIVDEACLSCPVMVQCLNRGIDNGEWGVWGSVFLTSGRPDKAKNAHKTADTWGAIRERIGADSIL